MSNIEYTRDVEIKFSSLVDEVFYNENSQSLYIDLGDYIYEYFDVPASVVDDFENAESAGAFYNTTLKGKYRSVQLGRWTEIDFEQVAKNAVFNTGGYIQGSTLTASPNFVLSGVGVSQVALANPSRTDVPADKFSLKPFSEDAVQVEGVNRTYIVTFEVEGLVDFRRHTLTSTSVDEAVKSVLDLGKMLDLTFIIREVTVKFE